MAFNLLAFTSKFSILDKKILRSRIQYLFLAMNLVLIPFFLIFLNEFNNIVEMRKNANKNYLWPQYTELYQAGGFTILVIILRILFGKLFGPHSERFISNKYKGKEREFKAEKFTDCSFKGIYYIFAFAIGYFVSKDSFFLSPALGGKGATDNMFLGFPYQDLNDCPYIKEYLMMQLGYHMFSLLQHIYKEPRNDFIEMLLHHIMTVLLISLAYYMNYLTMSILVLYTHDCSEIFGYLVRLFVDTPYTKLTLCWYLCLLVSWLYTRLLVFPFDLIRVAVYMNPVAHEIYGMFFLGIMLHFLLLLHIYWFYLFIQMGLKFLSTKVPEDSYHVE
jgi:TLC domain